MAENGKENGNKLTWWILTTGATVAVLLISFSINKFETMDRRVRAVEIVQGENRDYIRQLLALVAEMHTEQVNNALKFGEVNTKLSTLQLGMHTLDEKLTALQHAREER